MYAKQRCTAKSDCPNLDITVQLRIQNLPDISNFQSMLIAQQIPQDPDQYFLWHSTQQTNFTGYKNPHVDKLLEDGRKTLDQKERRSAYLDFQQYLVEDSPAIFLRHLTLYHNRSHMNIKIALPSGALVLC